jgi:hypothetical protein
MPYYWAVSIFSLHSWHLGFETRHGEWLLQQTLPLSLPAPIRFHFHYCPRSQYYITYANEKALLKEDTTFPIQYSYIHGWRATSVVETTSLNNLSNLVALLHLQTCFDKFGNRVAGASDSMLPTVHLTTLYGWLLYKLVSSVTAFTSLLVTVPNGGHSTSSGFPNCSYASATITFDQLSTITTCNYDCYPLHSLGRPQRKQCIQQVFYCWVTWQSLGPRWKRHSSAVTLLSAT